MSKVLEGYYYQDSHEWAKKDGNFVLVGITDYAQSQLGSVVFVDLPEVGSLVQQGKEFGAVESVKAASDLVCPVTGKIVEINEDLVGNPELLNDDPFAAWMIKVDVSDESVFNHLMDSEHYRNLIK